MLSAVCIERQGNSSQPGSASNGFEIEQHRSFGEQCADSDHGVAGTNPHFSPGFVARRRRRAWIQGARPRAPQAYSTVRRGARGGATKVEMPGYAAAVETW
jgi:hypothetical protein